MGLNPKRFHIEEALQEEEEEEKAWKRIKVKVINPGKWKKLFPSEYHCEKGRYRTTGKSIDGSRGKGVRGLIPLQIKFFSIWWDFGDILAKLYVSTPCGDFWIGPRNPRNPGIHPGFETHSRRHQKSKTGILEALHFFWIKHCEKEKVKKTQWKCIRQKIVSRNVDVDTRAIEILQCARFLRPITVQRFTICASREIETFKFSVS